MDNFKAVAGRIKLVAALLRVVGVTAGPAESNGSLPPGLWLTSPAGWLPRTGISSGTLRSVIECGQPFLWAGLTNYPSPPHWPSAPQTAVAVCSPDQKYRDGQTAEHVHRQQRLETRSSATSDRPHNCVTVWPRGCFSSYHTGSGAGGDLAEIEFSVIQVPKKPYFSNI